MSPSDWPQERRYTTRNAERLALDFDKVRTDVRRARGNPPTGDTAHGRNAPAMPPQDAVEPPTVHRRPPLSPEGHGGSETVSGLHGGQSTPDPATGGIIRRPTRTGGPDLTEVFVSGRGGHRYPCQAPAPQLIPMFDIGEHRHACIHDAITRPRQQPVEHRCECGMTWTERTDARPAPDTSWATAGWPEEYPEGLFAGLWWHWRNRRKARR